MAIAGRIAFSAFPNVKPSTDIVIFAGYALGGAPGFVVGALTALVSNFWFGQGPWTPWQMAGWGLCGILGAALALGTRNAGRFALAATCGVAALIYGALLNFSLMATYGGDLSWAKFGVLEVRAIPFEIAHFSGNVVLALVAGPAMVRMLTRFRERFEWRREGEGGAGAGRSRRPGPALRGGGIAALIVVCALAAGALAPARANASDVSRAADWLVSVQNPDGGFGASPGDDSGAEMTCWAMLGLEAAGRNPLDVARAGQTPVDFLRGGVAQLKSPGDLARTILALEGAGVDPRKFGGQNLVSKLLAKRRQDGSFEDWPNSTAYAVIALRAAGATGGLDKTLEWLRGVQNDDGGWGDTPDSSSNADGTGAVLQAIASGSKASHRGLAYLRRGPAQGRRLPARRQRSRQHPVDRLGDPGHHRRRRQPRLLPPRRRQRHRLPRQPASRATATTATPAPATRPPSGSPARSWSPPPANPSQSHRRLANPRRPLRPSRPKQAPRPSGGLPPSSGGPVTPTESRSVSPGDSRGRGCRCPPRTFCDPRAAAPPGRSPPTPNPGGETVGGPAPPALNRLSSSGSANSTETVEPEDSSSTAGADRAGPARRLPALRRRLGRPPRLDALALRPLAPPRIAPAAPDTLDRWT